MGGILNSWVHGRKLLHACKQVPNLEVFLPVAAPQASQKSSSRGLNDSSEQQKMWFEKLLCKGSRIWGGGLR